MAIVGGCICGVNKQFTDANGVPLAGGFVEAFVTGTATHKDTFSTSDLDPVGVNANPVVLDAAGRAPVNMYAASGGYDFTISDFNSVLITTVVGWEDIGQTLAANLGVVLTSGARNVTSGYTVVATDFLITVDGSGGPDPCLINFPAASTRTQQIIVKNLSATVGARIVPNGTDTIEVGLANWTINSSATPTFFTTTFAPDGTTWWIVNSHGF